MTSAPPPEHSSDPRRHRVQLRPRDVDGPRTPLVGVDCFVHDPEGRVLLIKRADNGLWALPGGLQDLGETPATTAVREVLEETGLYVDVQELLGVWSSTSYEYVHFPYKDQEFCHVLFAATRVEGELRPSEETPEVRWFGPDDLPEMSDGHEIRLAYGLDWLAGREEPPYFE